MTTKTIKIKAWGGEVYEIEDNGNMFSNPATGAQYGRPEEAMRAVLRDAVLAGGDDPDEEENADDIERFVNAALVELYGEDYIQLAGVEVTRYTQDGITFICVGDVDTSVADAAKAAITKLQDGERLADDMERIDGCCTWTVLESAE